MKSVTSAKNGYPTPESGRFVEFNHMDQLLVAHKKLDRPISVAHWRDGWKVIEVSALTNMHGANTWAIDCAEEDENNDKYEEGDLHYSYDTHNYMLGLYFSFEELHMNVDADFFYIHKVEGDHLTCIRIEDLEGGFDEKFDLFRKMGLEDFELNESYDSYEEWARSL